MQRKLTALLLAASLTALTLTACDEEPEHIAAPRGDEPLYDAPEVVFDLLEPVEMLAYRPAESGVTVEAALERVTATLAGYRHPVVDDAEAVVGLEATQLRLIYDGGEEPGDESPTAPYLVAVLVEEAVEPPAGFFAVTVEGGEAALLRALPEAAPQPDDAAPEESAEETAEEVSAPSTVEGILRDFVAARGVEAGVYVEVFEPDDDGWVRAWAYLLLDGGAGWRRVDAGEEDETTE